MKFTTLHFGHVAGLSYYPDGLRLLNKAPAKPGEAVTFKRDRANQYDSRATGVFYEGRQIGWVPKAENTAIAFALDNGIEVFGRIAQYDASRSAETRLDIAVYTVASDTQAAELNAILRAMHGTGQEYFQRSWRDPKNKLVYEEASKDHHGVYQKHVLNKSASSVPAPPAIVAAAKTTTPEEAVEGHFLRSGQRSTPSIHQEGKQPMSNLIDNMIAKNKQTATSAGFMEAGRIANNQIVKLATPHLPLIARGYLNTPIGKLVIANLAQLGASKFRPGDERLAKLTSAMMVQGWQEVFNDFDIEGMIEQLLSNSAIKKALEHIDPVADKSAGKGNGAAQAAD